MWTITTDNQTDETANVNATYSDAVEATVDKEAVPATITFSFSAKIKLTELDVFATRCKAELAKYQTKHNAKKEFNLESKLLNLLNN